MNYKPSKTIYNLKNLCHMAEVGQRWLAELKAEQGKNRDEAFIKAEEQRLKLIQQSIADIKAKFEGKAKRMFTIEYAATLSDYMKDKYQSATIEATSLQSAQKIIRKQLGRIYLKNMPYQKPK